MIGGPEGRQRKEYAFQSTAEGSELGRGKRSEGRRKSREKEGRLWVWGKGHTLRKIPLITFLFYMD